jgi:hypothetical protein
LRNEIKCNMARMGWCKTNNVVAVFRH